MLICSLFQVWEGSLSKGFGDAEGSTNVPNLDLQLGISNIYYSKAKVANAGSSRFNFNNNQTQKGEASNPGLDLKLATTQMQDPKRLKKYIYY